MITRKNVNEQHCIACCLLKINGGIHWYFAVADFARCIILTLKLFLVLWAGFLIKQFDESEQVSRNKVYYKKHFDLFFKGVANGLLGEIMGYRFRKWKYYEIKRQAKARLLLWLLAIYLIFYNLSNEKQQNCMRIHSGVQRIFQWGGGGVWKVTSKICSRSTLWRINNSVQCNTIESKSHSA